MIVFPEKAVYPLRYALAKHELGTIWFRATVPSAYYFKLADGPHYPRAWQVCIVVMYIPKVTQTRASEGLAPA